MQDVFMYVANPILPSLLCILLVDCIYSVSYLTNIAMVI